MKKIIYLKKSETTLSFKTILRKYTFFLDAEEDT